MLGVALALLSAVLFGGMSISLGFSMRRSRDVEVGAFVTALTGFLVCAVVAAVGREWGGKTWPFLLAGLLAPGGAQLLFVLAVREAGPARASVIAGAAPLVAVTIALISLGEPLRAPLVVGAVLIVVGRARPRRRARPPGHLPADRARLLVRLHAALRHPRQRRPLARHAIRPSPRSSPPRRRSSAACC